MTVLVPVFLGAYMFSVPMLTRSRTSNLRLAVVDTGTGLGDALADQLRAIEPPHIVVSEMVTASSGDAASRERFNAAVRGRALDGYLVIEGDLAPARTQYFARETGDPALLRQLALAVRSVAL